MTKRPPLSSAAASNSSVTLLAISAKSTVRNAIFRSLASICEILVSEATANAARSRYQLAPREPISVKNRTQPVPLFEIEWQHAVSNA